MSPALPPILGIAAVLALGLVLAGCTAAELAQGQAPSCAAVQADITGAKLALALAPVDSDTRAALAARLDDLDALVALACPAGAPKP